MSLPRLALAGSVAAIVLVIALYAVRRGPGDASLQSPGSTVAQGTGAPPRPPSQEEMAKANEQQRKSMDDTGRGLLKSFESRIYDPWRDSKLDYAEAAIDVRVDGKDAKFRFVFDAAKPADRQIEVTPVGIPEGLPDGVLPQVQVWGLHAARGACRDVAYYQPPTRLVVLPSENGKNILVWATPFHRNLNVSYSFDDRQVIAIRGEWASGVKGPAWRKVTNYDWEAYGGGRYLLRRAVVFDGPTTDFDYDDRIGLNMLSKARLRQGDRVFDAVFTYGKIRRRSP
jgi:hypothetical protein